MPRGSLCPTARYAPQLVMPHSSLCPTARCVPQLVLCPTARFVPRSSLCAKQLVVLHSSLCLTARCAPQLVVSHSSLCAGISHHCLQEYQITACGKQVPVHHRHNKFYDIFMSGYSCVHAHAATQSIVRIHLRLSNMK